MNLTPKGSIHLFHYIGNLRGESRHLYNKFEAHIHNLIGGSRIQASCQTIKDKLVRTKSKAGVSKETLEHGGPQVNEGEMKISLGEDVDQGLLLRFSKDERLWMVE
jgi:hypothetical protein